MSPRDPAVLPLDSQLCFALYTASIAMNRAYKPMLDAMGITYPQYLVLNALWEEDGRTIGAIAQRLALESSTITPLVKRLAAAGLVLRMRDPADERHVVVRLTPKGRALRSDSACLIDTVLSRTGLTLGETTALAGDIQRLRRALEEDKPGR